MSTQYQKTNLYIFKSFIYLILICTTFVFSVFGKPVTEKVAKIYHKGYPTELDGKDIEVIGESVALSERINMKKGTKQLYTPSIFFVIDNSFSMWADDDKCRRDSMGNRFTVTERIIKHMADNPKDYEGVEVGVSIFGTGLFYEGDDDPKVLQTLPDSLNPSKGNNGAYVPLLKLHEDYDTKNGTMKGSDILQNYLGTRIIGSTGGYRYRFPTASEDDANDGNTNIDLGFRAAVNAMKSSKTTKENHYIIFISDGAANNGILDEYVEGYVVDRDPLSPDTNLIPTTFTIFFQDEHGGHPFSLDNMNLNIKNNGYSSSNAIHTQLWDFNNSTEDELFNFIKENIISVIMKKQVWKELHASGASGPASWNEQNEKFVLPSLIPLKGIKTPIQYNIFFDFDIVNTRSTRSVPQEIKINFNTIINHKLSALDSMFQAYYWERTLGFYDEKGDSIIGFEGDDIEFILKFNNNPLDAGYEYTNVKIEVRSKNGRDIEVFPLKDNGSQKYSLKVDPKRVKRDADRNNGILEFRGHDTLIATFRNSEGTALPLDTLQTSITVTSEDLEMQRGIYFDNDANGRIDSIFVKILGEFDFTDDDLLLLKDHIKLPYHRKFTIKKVNSHKNGVSFNVSQNSAINTAVTDEDKLVIENEIKLSDYTTLTNGVATIIDSVSPVIMHARLIDHMNPEKVDTLSITFSEKVGDITVNKPFIFYSDKGKSKFDATVKPHSHKDNVAVFTLVTLSNNIKQISTGDSVNIYKSGKVADLAGNPQDNPDNIHREIEIHRILGLKEVTYFDNNADGRIDSIFTGIFGEYDFTHEDLAKLRDKVKLPDSRKFTIKNVNSLKNGFSFNVFQDTAVTINTAVTGEDILVFENDIELDDRGRLFKSSVLIADAVAPVIMRARLIDYMKPGKKDELTITFSEKVDSITSKTPFLFYTGIENKLYGATLNVSSQSGEIATFTVISLSDGMLRISSRDSINIFKDGMVFDLAGNHQDNPDNIRRKIEIEVIPAPFKVEIRSTLKTLENDFMRIQVAPKELEYSTEFDSLSAVFDIYDAVGNIVQEKLEMIFIRNREKMYLQYDWDCRNLIGREVGRGSYLALFRIQAYFLKEDGSILTQTEYGKRLKYLAVQK